MAEEDYRKEPYVKILIEPGWSVDRTEVKLYASGYADVIRRKHKVIDEKDAKRLINAFEKIDFQAVQKETSKVVTRDATRINLKLEGGKKEGEFYWDYKVVPATKKLEDLVDELVDSTRPDKGEKE